MSDIVLPEKKKSKKKTKLSNPEAVPAAQEVAKPKKSKRSKDKDTTSAGKESKKRSRDVEDNADTSAKPPKKVGPG